MNGVKLNLTDEDKAALRKRERVSDDSDVGFYICPCCAFPNWRYTRPGTGLTEAEIGDLCSRCDFFRFSNPQVFDWVTKYIVTLDFLKARVVK